VAAVEKGSFLASIRLFENIQKWMKVHSVKGTGELELLIVNLAPGT
jgi:hypothetical protein